MTSTILRNDLTTVAYHSFSAGVFLMIGVSYLVTGKAFGFVFTAPAVMTGVGAIIVAKRSLNRL